MTAKLLLCTGILAAIGLGEAAAQSDDDNVAGASYRGAHAIPKAQSGEFCYIEVAHTHTYLPDADMRSDFVERDTGGASRFEFTGDPTRHGFQGMSFSYFGAHPLDSDSDQGSLAATCELRNEHSHLRAPAKVGDYEERRGIYYFASYQEARRVARGNRPDASRGDRRATRGKDKSVQRRSSASDVHATATTPSSKPKPPAREAPKAAPKPDPHRSWMNRRLGR